MDTPASTRYEVAIAPLTQRSFWRRMFFDRVYFVANASAEAVSQAQATPQPTVFAGGAIVVRDRTTQAVRWQVAPTDLTGGTSPDQMVEDLESDLAALSVAAFEQKYGITAT